MERRQWLLGLLATLVLGLVWWAGGLEVIERLSLDFRARWFWAWSPEPSDRVVVVAIDDRSLETVGRWPWDREKLASVIDETRRAGARVVALDLLLDDPQAPRLISDENAALLATLAAAQAAAAETGGGGGGGATGGAGVAEASISAGPADGGGGAGGGGGGQAAGAPDGGPPAEAPWDEGVIGRDERGAMIRRVHDDGVLADAIQRHGAVVIAGSFKFETDTGETTSTADEADPSAGNAAGAGDAGEAGGIAEVGAPDAGVDGAAGPSGSAGAASPSPGAGAARGSNPVVPGLGAGLPGDDEPQAGGLKIALPRMFDAIERDPTVLELPEAEAIPRLARRFFPRSEAFTSGPEYEEVRAKFRAARTLLARAEDSGVAVPAGERRWARSQEPRPPVAELASASSRMANVTFDSYDPDGIVRRVPLWVRHRDRLWPTLGVAAVLRYWGVGLDAVRFDADRTRVELPETVGEDRELTMIRSRLRSGEVDGLHYITWPRGLTGQARMLREQVRRDARNAAAVRAGAERSAAHAGAALPEGATSAAAAAADAAADSDDDGVRRVRRSAAQATGGGGTGGGNAGATGEPDASAPRISGWAWQFYNLMSNQRGEVSAGYCYQPAQLTAVVRENVRSLTGVMEGVFGAQNMLPPDAAGPFRAGVRVLLTRATDDPAFGPALEAVAAAVDRAVAESRDWMAFAIDPATPEAEYPPEDLRRLNDLRRAIDTAPRQLAEIRRGIENIRAVRMTLASRLGGRIVFFGWTATGSTADFVGTSIDPRTPGVHVHAAVANAMLTDAVRVPVPVWADVLALVLCGLAGTWMAVRTSVVVAPLAVAAVVVGWFGVTGVIFWDRFALIASFSGPAVAASGGPLIVLLHRLFIEQRDRRATEDRFKSYVAPELVDILVENPELRTMRPTKREMTVMFSDVADFTTISEKLGPALLAKCLDKYLGEMTRVLQANRGTRDKYLGDGIMAFWNAPLEDADHVANACLTAVRMMQRLDELNDVGHFEEAGRLKVRIGLAAGELMVGDFGNPPNNSSYTVLGDTANLAARLESGNKFFGSRILTNHRVYAAVGDRFRFRAIGRVNVKGKKESELLHELVGELSPHGPATDEWIALTDAAVADYQAGRFDQAAAKFRVLDVRFGDHKLAELYADQIEHWKAAADPGAFNGAIVLTEK